VKLIAPVLAPFFFFGADSSFFLHLQEGHAQSFIAIFFDLMRHIGAASTRVRIASMRVVFLG